MSVAQPWLDEQRDPDLVPIRDLPAAEQDAAVQALQVAVVQIAGPDPERYSDLQRVAMIATAHLSRSKSTGALFVDVEHPRFERGFHHRRLSSQLDVSVASSSPFFVSLATQTAISYEHGVLTAGVRRPVPLEDALRLLSSDESPERELARRRAEVAAELAAAEKKATEDRAARAASDEAQRLYAVRNKDAIAAFEKLTPFVQAMAFAADEVPAAQDFVRAVMKHAGQRWRSTPLPRWMEVSEEERTGWRTIKVGVAS